MMRQQHAIVSSALLLLVSFTMAPHSALLAQSSANQLWLTYIQQGRLSNKWGYSADLNHRTKDYGKFTRVVSAARIGAVYYLDAKNRFTGGYAWFGTHVNQGNGFSLLHEHRLWQQWQHFRNVKKLSYFHRVRVDERWRQVAPSSRFPLGGTLYSTRLRYMFQIQGPIIQPASGEGFGVNWAAGWEIMGHAGEGVGTHYFEQNRFIAGVLLHPYRNLELAVLLQNTIQYSPILESAQHFNVLRLTLAHQLDFRKNNKK